MDVWTSGVVVCGLKGDWIENAELSTIEAFENPGHELVISVLF